jgi:hypothetical protein
MALCNADYCYSVTVLVEEEPVLYCLRGISMYAQGEGNVYKPWCKAGRKEWDRNHIVTFHFTNQHYRQVFEQVASDLLGGRWTKVGDSDDNPLPPGD